MNEYCPFQRDVRGDTWVFPRWEFEHLRTCSFCRACVSVAGRKAWNRKAIALIDGHPVKLSRVAPMSSGLLPNVLAPRREVFQQVYLHRMKKRHESPPRSEYITADDWDELWSYL